MGPFIDFVGNDSFAYAEVREAMKYAPDDQETLDVDLLYIAAFYWDHGFAQVNIPSASWNADRVAIHIDEGAKFTLGKLVPPVHDELITLRTGEVFSRSRIADDRERLHDYYADRGYAFVEVFPLVELHVDAKTVDLSWSVDPGPRARIGVVTVVGAAESLVRPILGIAEHEWFDAHRLSAAKQALIAKGFDVAISTKHGARKDLVDVMIELTAK